MRIIAGLLKNRRILSPKSTLTRPTSEKLRETLFNICQTYIKDTDFLDLFAGSGAMGIEALSRGARMVTFVDAERESIRCIRKNLEDLKITESCTIISSDVFEGMKKLLKAKDRYDIIFADPPYDAFSHYRGEKISFSECVVRMLDESDLLKQGGMLFIEDSADSQPVVDKLQSLELISSRRLGRSALQQYQKK